MVTWDPATDTEKIKEMMRASFSCIYVTPTVTRSYETALPPHPFDPGSPQNPLHQSESRRMKGLLPATSPEQHSKNSPPKLWLLHLKIFNKNYTFRKCHSHQLRISCEICNAFLRILIQVQKGCFYYACFSVSTHQTI